MTFFPYMIFSWSCLCGWRW